LVTSTGDVRVAVHELGGDASARPLLCAHATGFHGRVFEPMVTAGLASVFHCVGADLRGHGDSEIPVDVDFAWEGFRDDVLAVIDDVGASPSHQAYGVGHSMGGAALLMAELARPGTFAGLYLFEPIVPPPGPIDFARGNPMAESAERRREVFPSLDHAVANYASKPPLNRLRADALNAYVVHGFAPLADGTVRLKCRGTSEAATFRMAGGHGTFARLGEISCPVTIAMGLPMEMGPAAFAPAAADALPNGRLEHFDHLSHFGPLEAPDEVAAAILRSFSA
jgi:pimeloyl-ACP methyl ester carboxylesterase